MAGLYATDPTLLDSFGRILVVIGFMAAAIRNVISRAQIEDHVARLAATNAPMPRFAFWFGTAFEVVGCAMLLFDFHAATGALILLIFTVAATALLLRWWEHDEPKRSGMQNGFNANIAVCGGLLLLMARLPW